MFAEIVTNEEESHTCYISVESEYIRDEWIKSISISAGIVSLATIAMYYTVAVSNELQYCHFTANPGAVLERHVLFMTIC